MKCLQLNASLTIGTLDGANVERAEKMGLKNIFIFGMTVDEVEVLKCGGYNAEDFVNSNVELAEVMEQLKSGFFLMEMEVNSVTLSTIF